MIKQTHYRCPLCGHYVTEAEFVAAGTAKIYCEGCRRRPLSTFKRLEIIDTAKGGKGDVNCSNG